MSAQKSEFRRSSAGSIVPILRIANEIEHQRPRVAYLCRFYACERAFKLVVSSSERYAMRQFKDNAPSLASRVENTDAREIESYYKQYYAEYIGSLKQGDQADRLQLAKAYQTAGVLFEVLCAVNKMEKAGEFAPEIIASARDVQERIETYAPYNFLPLNSSEKSQKIMQQKEVRAAVAALRNIHGLKWPSTFDQYNQQAENLDLLDWLPGMYLKPQARINKEKQDEDFF